MKKNFTQPELQVVRINNDIVTYSVGVAGEAESGWEMEAPGRRFDNWDAE